MNIRELIKSDVLRTVNLKIKTRRASPLINIRGETFPLALPGGRRTAQCRAHVVGDVEWLSCGQKMFFFGFVRSSPSLYSVKFDFE